MMVQAGFNSPPFFTIDRYAWIKGQCKDVWEKAKKDIGFPMVIKPANQGSSIGVSILSSNNEVEFMSAVEKALFTKWVDAAEWKKLNEKETDTDNAGARLRCANRPSRRTHCV